MYILGGVGAQRNARRVEAELSLLLMILSFVVSAVLTGTYNQLTGFPQVGAGDLHISQILLGGFLPSATTLLAWKLENRWALRLSAILGGVGVGLFIDEVGKFLTKTIDYFKNFYLPPLAVIYGLFLLTLFLYLHTRSRSANDTNSESHHALDYLTELIDADVDEVEREEINTYLQIIASNGRYPDRVQLADTLIESIHAKNRQVIEQQTNRRDQWRTKLRVLEAEWSNRPLVKALIIIGLMILGLQVVSGLLGFATVYAGLASRNGLGWYIALQALYGFVGVILLASASLIIIRREQVGLLIGYWGLLLYLVSVNLLDSYANPFTLVLQLGLLFAIIVRRRRYLTPDLVPPL